jgi:hypothetical protein
MATNTDITTGVQTVSATGAVTPTTGLDISGISGDFTIFLEVTGMTAGKTARIQFEDSVNAFTASVPVAVINVTGALTSAASQVFDIRKYQLPNNRFGVTSAVLRVNVTAIDSGSSLSLHAWIAQ